jgi:Fur family peroxide stress response transcriptional regulator
LEKRSQFEVKTTLKKTGERVDSGFNARLAAKGFRFTPQRERVYGILLETRDHPTAEQVFLRAKQFMPEISMATVYNCLDALVQCRLAREVNLDRGATRYCPNMSEHLHFYCDACGGVYDIEYAASTRKSEFDLPKGFQATALEVSIHGSCSDCAANHGTKR